MDSKKAIDAEIKKLAKQAGRRHLAQALQAAQEMEDPPEIAALCAAAAAEQKRVERKLHESLTCEGALPSALQEDIKRLRQMPTVEEVTDRDTPIAINCNPIGSVGATVQADGSINLTARGVSANVQPDAKSVQDFLLSIPDSVEPDEGSNP